MMVAGVTTSLFTESGVMQELFDKATLIFYIVFEQNNILLICDGAFPA